MPKIITITVNTAIDQYVEIKDLRAGGVIKAQSSRLFAAGKGVNVAKTIAALKFNVTALGFVGKDALHLFRGLDSPHLQTRFTAVAGKTRTNITLHETANKTETHIRTQGFTVKEKQQQALFSVINDTITANDIVVLSGSLPPGLTGSFYDAVLKLCHERQAIILLDTEEFNPLADFPVKPFLLKLNESEFSQKMGCKLCSEQEISAAALQVVQCGTAIVVVSMGEKGAVIADGQANILYHAAVRIDDANKTVSSVGCGDAMLGGLSVGLAAGYTAKELIKFGVSCGAANLFSKQPGEIDLATVTGLGKEVRIREINPE